MSHFKKGDLVRFVLVDMNPQELMDNGDEENTYQKVSTCEGQTGKIIRLREDLNAKSESDVAMEYYDISFGQYGVLVSISGLHLTKIS